DLRANIRAGTAESSAIRTTLLNLRPACRRATARPGPLAARGLLAPSSRTPYREARILYAGGKRLATNNLLSRRQRPPRLAHRSTTCFAQRNALALRQGSTGNARWFT